MKKIISVIVLIISCISVKAQFDSDGNLKIGYQKKIYSLSVEPYKFELTPFTINGDTEFRNYYGTGDFKFFVSNGTHGNGNTIGLLIKENGNIGIGTTNPSQKLDINGGVKLNLDTHGQGLRLINNANSAGTYVTFTDHDGKSANIGSFDDNYADINYRNSLQFFARNGKDFRFATSPNGNAGTNKLVILNNGNIGIGTINPDMKLTVNGNIHAKEVKIDLNIPAPDYVFKKDYDLRTIEELEKFIEKNNHLPEIPSAKQFEKNGVMQAEMDMNLLKKIEELTLYTIQQQKEIEELKSLVKQLIELKK